MGTITRHRAAVKANSKRTVGAYLMVVINDVAYKVERISPGEDGTVAFRLEKQEKGAEVYDLIRDHHGLIRCDCPSYVATYEGTTSTCKHGQALVITGLMEAPAFVAQPATSPVYRAIPDEFDEPTPVEVTAPTVEAAAPPAFDAEFYRCQDAVSSGRALWLSHRHLHTSEPMPATLISNEGGDAEPRLIDDDGTPLETPAEMDERHRAEHAAKVAALMEGNPFLPPCCDPGEPMPCEACLAHEGPGDLSDDGWDDSHVWSTSDFAPEPDDEPGPRSLAQQIDVESRHYRTLGTPFGDLLAHHLEGLSDRVRFLGASTVDDYQDRYRALLDSVQTEASTRRTAAIL